MDKLTLLQRAKKMPQIRKKFGLSDEIIELAIAWAKDEVTLGQCSRAMYNKSSKSGIGGSILYKFASAFRELYRQKKIKIIN